MNRVFTPETPPCDFTTEYSLPAGTVYQILSEGAFAGNFYMATEGERCVHLRNGQVGGRYSKYHVKIIKSVTIEKE